MPTVGELGLLDLTKRERSARPTEHTDWAGSRAFSPDGKLLAFAGGGEKATVVVWDVTTPAVAKKIPTGYDRVYDVALSPDGKTLAAACDPTLRLYDVASGKEVEQPEGHPDTVKAVAES